MRRLAAFAAVLAAASARAAEPPASAVAPWSAALTFGAGAMHDGAGLGLEVRRGRVAGFLGVGSEMFGAPPESGPRGRGLGSLALGARLFSGEGERAMLTVHSMLTSWDGLQTHHIGWQGRALVGATVGWRQRLGAGFFAQAGIGAAARYERYDRATEAPVARWSVVPDFDAALGIMF